MKKIIFGLITVLFISGCTITPTYETIPKTEEDFQLSKDEILKKFPAIADHHIENTGESSKHIPTYNDLVDKWGEPVSERAEWFQHFWRLAHLSGMGYTVADGFNDLFFIFEGVVLAIAPFPPKTYTWKKEHYNIEATYINAPFTDDKHCIHWNWKVKNENNSTNILPKKLDRGFYFRFGYSSGGERVFQVKNSTEIKSIGFGTTLQLGYEYQFSSNSSDKIKLASGLKYSGFLMPAFGSRLVEYPVDAVYFKKAPKLPLNLGVGIGYKISPTIHNFSDNQNNFKLDNAFSLIFELESSIWHKNDSSFRYEFLKYSGDGINDIRGNNFSLFFNHYF